MKVWYYTCEIAMKDSEVRKYWEENADAWTQLARAGYDTYRDHLNTPAFFRMLPNVSGLLGLDVGCGEGYNTRRLAARGATVIGIDLSETFIQHACTMEKEHPQGIRYYVASGEELPFDKAGFDFATAFMSLMDIARVERALEEVYRVLKPGAFFQFSITHPCFDTPYRLNLRDQNGQTYAYEIGGYFEEFEGEIAEWIFSAAPSSVKEQYPKFKIPSFRRTLSQWLNLLIEKGFMLEQFQEPKPDDATVQKVPNIQDAQIIPYFLHIRVRKPAVVHA